MNAFNWIRLIPNPNASVHIIGANGVVWRGGAIPQISVSPLKSKVIIPSKYNFLFFGLSWWVFILVPNMVRIIVPTVPWTQSVIRTFRCTWWVTCAREPTKETRTRRRRSTMSTAPDTWTWSGGLPTSSSDSFVDIYTQTRSGSSTMNTVSKQKKTLHCGMKEGQSGQISLVRTESSPPPPDKVKS